MLGIRGEVCLIGHIQDKGYIIITGCGHPQLEYIIKFIKNNLVGGEKIYAIYGGLHIDPFGTRKNVDK